MEAVVPLWLQKCNGLKPAWSILWDGRSVQTNKEKGDSGERQQLPSHPPGSDEKLQGPGSTSTGEAGAASF